MFVTNNATPIATAEIRGNAEYKSIRGTADLYDTYEGTIIIVEIQGIPEELEKKYGGFYGFHIHEGASCTGTAKAPFSDAGTHYNPKSVRHPYHAGDLPPLLSSNGTLWAAIYTKRFYPEDVIGRTIIVHEKPDDFHTQPSGDAGEMIACGKIVAWDRELR